MRTEREGFEPSRRFKRLHAFQACLIDHSSTSPDATRSFNRQASLHCILDESWTLNRYCHKHGGVRTSIPLIIAGAALIMALLERYRVLVWGGGALLGWVAGDIMATDPAVAGWVGEATLDIIHSWGGPIGAVIVVVAGYRMVRKHRPLAFDELFAGLALLVWIAVNFWAENMFSADADHYKVWVARGVLFAILVIVYFAVRGRKAVSAESA